MKTQKKVKPSSQPQTVISHCTFTSHPVSGDETVRMIASALEATAQALNALANQLGKSSPNIVINTDQKPIIGQE